MHKHAVKIWSIRLLAGLALLAVAALLFVWMYLRGSLAIVDGSLNLLFGLREGRGEPGGQAMLHVRESAGFPCNDRNATFRS